VYLTTAETKLSEKGLERLTREARHELAMLPFHGVFDNLAYRVAPDETVPLVGQVTRSMLKSDAERALKGIEGMPFVINELAVMPLSPSDDQLRLAPYRATDDSWSLNRHAMMPESRQKIIKMNKADSEVSAEIRQSVITDYHG